MTQTINTKTFTRDSGGKDDVTYLGPSNTISVVDIVEYKRTKPKAGGGSLGVARPVLRRVKSNIINATTAERANSVLRVEGSIAVGTSDADIEALVADLVSVLGLAEVKMFFKTLALPNT